MYKSKPSEVSASSPPHRISPLLRFPIYGFCKLLGSLKRFRGSLSDDILGESLRFLERFDIEVLQLVSRSFSRIALSLANTLPLHCIQAEFLSSTVRDWVRSVKLRVLISVTC